MAPTMPPSVPSAGGSRNVIARCVATRCRRMPCASVASSPGVATSSIPKKEPSWQGSCSKQELLGSLTAFSFLTSGYQLSNDHHCGMNWPRQSRGHINCLETNDTRAGAWQWHVITSPRSCAHDRVLSQDARVLPRTMVVMAPVENHHSQTLFRVRPSGQLHCKWW